MKILFDTSVLVAAMVEPHPMHSHAFPWLVRAKSREFDMAVAAHTLAELYAVLTTLPLIPRITPGAARRLIHDNVETTARVISLSSQDYVSVIKNLSDSGLFGGIIYGALIALLMVVLVFAVGELAWLLIKNLGNDPILLLENHELTNVLGAFLLVLIGVELLDTILEYFRENAIHVEIVVLLSIIAIARKVILLDPSTSNGLELVGIGFIIIGLSAGYFMIKKAGITIGHGIQPKE